MVMIRKKLLCLPRVPVCNPLILRPPEPAAVRQPRTRSFHVRPARAMGSMQSMKGARTPQMLQNVAQSQRQDEHSECHSLRLGISGAALSKNTETAWMRNMTDASRIHLAPSFTISRAVRDGKSCASAKRPSGLKA